MKDRLLILIFLCLLLFFGVGCVKKEKRQGFVLAQVGSDYLYEENFRSIFSDEEWQGMDKATKDKYIQDWVNLTLLAQEAEERGLSKDLDVLQKLDFATKKVKANALIAQKLASIEVSEDELFAYYRIHKGEFEGKALEYNVQRIYLMEKSQALQCISDLEAGADFDALVKSQSQELLRDKLGHMGYVNPAGADSLFWNQARRLPLGKYAMFAADGGWYVIRVLDNRESNSDMMFEDFAPQIQERILKERHEMIYQELLKNIKSRLTDVYYY